VSYKLKAALRSALVPEVGPLPTSFTRNLAAYVVDFEGLLKLAPANCARFTGARFVQNQLLNSSLDFWTAGVPNNCTRGASATFTQIAGWNGIGSALRFSATNGGNVGNNRVNFILPAALIVGRKYVISARVRRNNAGTGALRYAIDSTGTFDLAPAAGVDGAWRRFAAAPITILTANGNFGFYPNAAGEEFDIDDVQYEDVTGQTNTNPSEYINNGTGLAFPYQGAGADGCQFFEYLNGNTVDAVTFVVTEAKGAAIPAATLRRYRKERAATQKIKRTDFATGSGWSAAVLTSVAGPLGSVNAKRISWVAQSFPQFGHSTIPVIAGVTYTLSAWMKHDTPGALLALVSNAGNLALNTNFVATGAWQELVVTATAAGTGNANFLLVFDNSGAVTTGGCNFDLPQMESGPTRTSFIPNLTGAEITRPEDLLAFPLSAISDAAGTAYANFQVDLLNGASGPLRVIGNSNTGAAGAPLTINGNTFGAATWDGASNVNGPAGPYLSNTPIRSAVTWAGAVRIAYTNGAKGSTGTYDGSFDLTGIGIGTGGGWPMQGHIGDVVILDNALSEFDVPKLPNYVYPTLADPIAGACSYPPLQAGMVNAPVLLGSITQPVAIVGVVK
jgi:hypothetical protein